MIWFNSKKAREYLIRNGEIVTCRKGRKNFGVHRVFYTNDRGLRDTLGLYNVEYLEESFDNQREHDKAFSKYIHLSGFNSVKQWKEEVRKLNNNRWMPDYLIFIKVSEKVIL